MENRFPAEISEQFDIFASELVALNVDVLVAINLLAKPLTGLGSFHGERNRDSYMVKRADFDVFTGEAF